MDRRRALRSRMIKRGQLVSGGASLNCVVLDLSRTGARIHLAAPSKLPEVVVLRLPDGALRNARRRWQRDADAGLEFFSVASAIGARHQKVI
ncbi:MAG TPA: PilZ domain-containing protein [Roseomonas sp.]|jgi:hypothetical protein